MKQILSSLNKNRKKALFYFSIYFIAAVTLLLISCDEGLAPSDSLGGRAVFSGNIVVKGGAEAWPDSSEVVALRIGAFKTDNPSSLIDEVLAENAYFTLLSVGTFFDTVRYKIVVSDAPATIVYSIAALQIDTSLTSQRVVGVYGGNETPASFTINPGDSLTDIDFYIDFENLPPQPF
ncbi:MAG: hypothetical protein Kapaf2KO_17650 [Candidatus Kapaibacteriales bacterium]